MFKNKGKGAEEDSSEDEDEDEKAGSGGGGGGGSGWGGFRWGGMGVAMNGWFGGGGNNAVAVDAPSAGDFARNFDMASPDASEIDDPYDAQGDDEEYYDGEEGDHHAWDDHEDDEGDYDDYERDGEEGGDDVPLVPGTYRAIYSFEPEGTAEMALEEDQVVKVVGRGGGVGWAIVEREGTGEHALVPEGYLELVEAAED